MRLIRPFLLVVLVLGLIFAVRMVNQDQASRPVVLTHDVAQIQSALAGAHWVSPGVTTPGSQRALYMVSFRTCPYCRLFEDTQFARLQKAGIDTRLIMVARRDRDGEARSTPVERATVAELWRARDWGLYQRWAAATPELWETTAKLPEADADPARAAQVEAARATVDHLSDLLAENGVDLAYPALIWQGSDGRWRAYIGYDPKAADRIRADLGAA